MKGLFDTNLDFPLPDRRWRDFFTAESCDIASTADLDMLTDALRQHRADFSYLPVRQLLLPARRRRLSRARERASARTETPSQNSVLVVKTSNPATRWQDLRNARLGYINTYCTTSYFAPSILIAREGLTLNSFFKAGPVAAWQGQIDAVVDGSIDVTMVYEDVWLARADNAARTKIIARIDDLPTPAVIVRSDIGRVRVEAQGCPPHLSAAHRACPALRRLRRLSGRADAALLRRTGDHPRTCTGPSVGGAPAKFRIGLIPRRSSRLNGGENSKLAETSASARRAG